MKNKALWTFSKNNSETIQELTDSLNKYRNSFYQKIYQLNNDILPQNEFAPAVNTDISIVAKTLTDLLTKIENYKKKDR